MDNINELEERLAELEELIGETKKRLPAHSTKPPVMIDLINLEDEYDNILRRIKNYKIN